MFTHSVDGHLGTFQLLQESYWVHSSVRLFVAFSFPLDKCLGVELLDHRVEQFNHRRNFQMICQQVIPLDTPANSVWEFQFYTLTNI